MVNFTLSDILLVKNTFVEIGGGGGGANDTRALDVCANAKTLTVSHHTQLAGGKTTL